MRGRSFPSILHVAYQVDQFFPNIPAILSCRMSVFICLSGVLRRSFQRQAAASGVGLAALRELAGVDKMASSPPQGHKMVLTIDIFIHRESPNKALYVFYL